MNQRCGQPLVVLSILLAVIAMSCTQVIPPAEGKETWKVFSPAESPIAQLRIYSMYPAAGGKMWFGTDSGATSFERGFWSTMKDSIEYTVTPVPGYSLKKRTVLSIASDYDGSLWLGTAGGGILRYSQSSPTRPWIRYRIPDVLNDEISGVVSEPLQWGGTWTISDSGIDRFQPNLTLPMEGTWTQYPIRPRGTVTDRVLALAINPRDYSMLFGMNDGHMLIFADQSGWQRIPVPSGSAILSISVDYAGYAWCGTTNGVAVLDTKKFDWKEYTPQTTGIIPQGRVTSVATNRTSSVRWFGTNSGLLRLADTTWTLFDRQQGYLPTNYVTSLAYDRKGNLWIGTAYGVAVHNERGIDF